MPTLDSLVDDIYGLFDPNKMHEPNEENLNQFADNMKNILRTRLASREDVRDPLRFSALGKPDRQLWYMAKGYPSEEMTPKTYFKFLYGDVIEALLLFLAKESGHDVQSEQMEIEVDGVKGHIDAIIDGVVVDVKSASPFGYKKFKDHSIVQDDPFGYIQQISGYTDTITPGKGGAFLAADKVSGDLTVMNVSSSIIETHPPAPRIAHLKEVIAQDTPPPRCFDPEPDGKSGNMKLGTQCSYCAFKTECWPGLRTFIYSTGPRYLTTVVKVPDVYEVV